MKNPAISGFKEIIESQVRLAYENQMNEALEKLIGNSDSEWESIKAKLRRQIKDDANRLTLEMLQKMNSGTLSVEFKL